jgi:hypothetical protein
MEQISKQHTLKKTFDKIVMKAGIKKKTELIVLLKKNWVYKRSLYRRKNSLNTV